MPQIIFFAAVGAGLYAGFRALARAGEQFAANLKGHEDAVRQQAHARRDGVKGGEKDLGTLEYDAKSGVYRPVIRQP